MLKGNKHIKKLNNKLIIFDIILILVGTLGVYWMTNWSGNPYFTVKPAVVYWAIANIVLVFALLTAMRIYTIIYASVGFPEALRIVVVTAIVAAVNLLFVFVWGRGQNIGYSVVLFYSLILLCGLTASRFAKRFYCALKTQVINAFTKKVRVMIIGCNNDAFTLIRNMVFNDKSRYKAVCLVDDDNRYLGKRQHEFPYLKPRMNAPK